MNLRMKGRVFTTNREVENCHFGQKNKQFLGDHKGIILIEFSAQGKIKRGRYCKTLKKLKKVIHNKRREMLPKGVCLSHDNARPYLANVTKKLLASFVWDVLNHTTFSSDLVPLDYLLITSLKMHICGEKSSTYAEVINEVTKWSKEVAGKLFFFSF